MLKGIPVGIFIWGFARKMSERIRLSDSAARLA
jgi:hypothetical protein